MLVYDYKTSTIHDHKCDNCGIVYITMCTKDCDPPDELCYECYQEYQRFVKKQERFK